MRQPLLPVAAWCIIAVSSASCVQRRGAARPTASPRSTAERLRTTAGDMPVFFVLDRTGNVRAETPDRRVSEELVAGPVLSALFDPELEVVWLRREDRLEALDLRAAGSAPRVVATGLPDVKDFAVGRTVGGRYRTIEHPAVCERAELVTLECDITPRLTLTTVEEGETSPPGASVVDAAWLSDAVSRPPAHAESRVDFSDATVLPTGALLRARMKCDDPDDCGRAVPFGASGWELVLVESRTGADCEHYGCLLYDPGTRRFAEPPDVRAWGTAAAVEPGLCGLYQFDRSGSRFLIHDLVCGFGTACRQIDGITLGWLDGGRTIGPEA